MAKHRNIVVFLMVELKDFQKKLARAQKDIGRFTANLASGLNTAGRSVAALGGVVMGGVGAVVKAASDFETAFTGVRKTVDASEEDFARLREGILEMARRIPQSQEALAGIMEVAGQLGIRGVDNLLAFTETMAMLADTTNISGEEGALQLARFMNVIGTGTEDVGRLGAVLADLGNNFAAREGEILDTATNLAAFGRQVGLTDRDVLALSTTITQSGGEAAAAATAFQSIGISMKSAVIGTTDKAKDSLKKFADIAGMSSEAFAQLFREDSMEALTRFLEGLKQIEKQGGSSAEALDAMGLADKRLLREVFKVSENTDKLREATERSNRAFREGTALSEEAAKRYETFASKVSILWNRIKELGIELGGPLADVLKDLITQIEPVLTKWGEWIKANRELIGTKFGEYVAQARDFVVSLWENAGALVNKIKEWTGANTETIISIGALVAAFSPLMVGLGGVTIAMGSALTAVSAFATALKALFMLMKMAVTPPVGAVVLLAVGIAGLYQALYNWDKGGKNFIQEFVDQVPLARKAIDAYFDFWVGWLNQVIALYERIKGLMGVAEGHSGRGASVGDRTQELIDSGAMAPQAFARGGLMGKTGLALVGERGPELLALAGGTRVFNNHETKRILNSAPTVNTHVSLNGAVIREQADIGRLANAITKKTIDALRERGLRYAGR